MDTTRPTAIASGVATGAVIGRMLGIGAVGTILGVAAGAYLAWLISMPPRAAR